MNSIPPFDRYDYIDPPKGKIPEPEWIDIKFNELPKKAPISPRIKEIKDQERKLGEDIKWPTGRIKRRHTV